jgi:hypothetical protein
MSPNEYYIKTLISFIKRKQHLIRIAKDFDDHNLKELSKIKSIVEREEITIGELEQLLKYGNKHYPEILL